MNRTANAIEIKFSFPTTRSPAAAVTQKPTTSARVTGQTIRQERSARKRIIRTEITVPAMVAGALSRKLPNSSSLIGTWPVSRMLAPKSDASFRSAAVCRIASVAARPGSSAEKSSLGSTAMKRRNASVLAGRPCTRTRQEKLAGCAAITRDNVSAPRVSGRARSLSFACLL